MSRGLLAVFVACLTLPSVHGGVIYSTFGPGYSFGPGAWQIGSTTPAAGERQQVFAPFEVLSSAMLDSISVAVRYRSGIDQATVFLASTDGVNTTLIENWSITDIPHNLPPNATVETVASSLHPLLSAGVTYVVGMTADDLINTRVGWASNNQNILGVSYWDQGTTSWVWDPSAVAPAFEVTGTPEPASTALLAGGVIGLGLWGRWVRRRDCKSLRQAG